MVTIWDLNPIVLGHTDRFFRAAARVLEGWYDQDEALLGALVELSGNMLWARSSFEAASRAEEHAMAHGGAFLGTMGDRAVKGLLGQGPATALAELERQVRQAHDAILAALARDLGQDRLETTSPARLNKTVWERLFPGYDHEASHQELCSAIRDRLERSAT